MRVALYARVSTSRQAQAQTIEQQLERLQAHVQAQGETVAERAVFRDAGYRGAAHRGTRVAWLHRRVPRAAHESGPARPTTVTDPRGRRRVRTHLNVRPDAPRPPWRCRSLAARASDACPFLSRGHCGHRTSGSSTSPYAILEPTGPTRLTTQPAVRWPCADAGARVALARRRMSHPGDQRKRVATEDG